MRWVRFLVGVMLLPLCGVATHTLMALVEAAQEPSAAWVPASALALIGGFLAWLVVYFAFPKPVRSYIVAHELTHALWGAVMGARIFRMKISKSSGSVTLSKNNFLIALAPYFFPLYTIIVIVTYYVLSIFLAVERYHLVWLTLVGQTWGFHFTFTITTLMQHQTDIQEYGSLFSYTLIYLMNVLGICLWVVMVSSATLWQMACSISTDVVDLALLARVGAEWVLSRIPRNGQ